MSVLTDYKVVFYNDLKLGKSLSTIDELLTGFIADHYYLGSANELFNDINTILSPPFPIAKMPTQSMYFALITNLETKLYDNIEKYAQNELPDFTLPTSAFKIIVESWRNYLQVG